MGFMRRAAGSINISKRPRPADRGSNDRAVVQRLDSRRGVRLPRPRGEPRTPCFGVFTDPPSLRGQRGGKLLLPVCPRWPSAKLLNRHPASQKWRATSLLRGARFVLPGGRPVEGGYLLVEDASQAGTGVGDPRPFYVGCLRPPREHNRHRLK